MADLRAVEVGMKVRVTHAFREEWLDDVIYFDGGLHHPVEVPQGIEGMVHSLQSPGSGLLDVRYPKLLAWPGDEKDGVRVATSRHDIEFL